MARIEKQFFMGTLATIVSILIIGGGVNMQWPHALICL
jgi:hypothetical protein